MARASYKDISKKNFFDSVSRVYFLYGKDKCMVRECKKTILSKLMGENQNNLDLLKLDGESIDFDKLTMSLNMYPISGNLKCILVNNLDLELFSSNDLKKLNQIIENVPEFSTIIICQTFCEVNEKKSSKWRKFLSLISQVGNVVDCSVTLEKEMENKIVSIVEDRNKAISKENTSLLLKLCGRNLDVIYSEVEKLCNFENEKEISRESIKKIVCSNLEYNVFEICKFILSGDLLSVYECMEKLFLFKEEPILILSIISSTYVDMYRFKVCYGLGIYENEILNIFDYKGKEYKIRSAKYNSRNISLDSIRKSIDVLIKADEEIKTTSVSPRVIIDVAIIKLINLVSRNG